MAEGAQTIIFPVKDLERAKTLFTALLGAAPSQDAPYYVGYEVHGQSIGLNPGGHAQGMTGATAFWAVDDIEGRLAALVEAGATVVQDVTAVGGGRRIASAKDADGNMIGLMQDS
jgi:predicted enzyme related to lactoylglutathione lyase